jgi:hypothetical protein
MALSQAQLNILEEEVKSYMTNLEDIIEPNCVARLNNKEIPIYFYLPRSESQYGDWEPPFCYPSELISDLINRLALKIEDDNELDDILKLIDQIACKYSPVTRNARIFRDVFGGTMQLYTIVDINDQEWEKVIEAVSKAYKGYGNGGTLERNWPYLIEIKE